MRLTVARIGRAHGLKGEVGIEVRTDDPETRFATGSILETEPKAAGPLTVAASRNLNGRWFLRIEGVSDRTGAEGLRGVELLADAAQSDEEDAWYPHQLTGLRAELLDGTIVGEVAGLENSPAHDMLIVVETNGARSPVPFVRQIVPVVDVAGGRVVLDPPGGLLARDAELLEVAEPQPGSGADDGDDAGEGAGDERPAGDGA